MITTCQSAIFAILVVLFCSRLQSDAAKILFVPANINSHVIYFGRLAETLSQLGHSTHMLVASNAHVPKDLKKAAEAARVDGVGPASTVGHFTIERYLVDGNVSFTSSPKMTETMISAALTSSTFEKFRILGPFFAEMLTAFSDDCSRLLGNAALVDRLGSDRYDIAIMDPAFSYCYVLPYALRIPYHASLSVPCFVLEYRVPRLPSFVSDFGHTDRMSFLERLSSFMQSVMLNYVIIKPDLSFAERFAPDRPPVDVYQLVYRSSLWFYLEEPSLSFPRPLMPNTVQIGDLMAGRPGHPLEAEIEKFVTESVSGIVIVSFGSYLDYVPDSIMRQFCEAFAGLESTVGVIWRQTNSTACDGVDGFDRRRVLLLPWIPQNDLLADKRVRLFVTHGGLNGLVEAAYHGKPVVVLPVSLDQPANAAVVVSRGYGVRVDLSTSGTDLARMLKAAINKVLGDRSYAERSKFASSLMNDRRDTPAERVSFAIDHVLKYGDSHLRTGAFDLSIWQFLMFDLFVAMAAVFVALVGCLALTGRWACRRCCSKRLKTKKE